MSDVIPLAGAVDGLRMLKDGGVSVTLIFEPKDRVAVMTMMGQPGASIACVRLKDGHAAIPAPAAQFRDLGPVCREAIDLCNNQAFQKYVVELRAMTGLQVPESEKDAREFVCSMCRVESRKDLDTVDGANKFRVRVRIPFQQWLRKQEQS